MTCNAMRWSPLITGTTRFVGSAVSLSENTTMLLRAFGDVLKKFEALAS